jgi:hypothetical protein
MAALYERRTIHVPVEKDLQSFRSLRCNVEGRGGRGRFPVIFPMIVNNAATGSASLKSSADPYFLLK